MNHHAKQQTKAVLWGKIARGTQIAFIVCFMLYALFIVFDGMFSTPQRRTAAIVFIAMIALLMACSAVSLILARIHQARYLIQTRLKACPGCLYSFAGLSRLTTPGDWLRCPECGHPTRFPLLQHWWRDRIRRTCAPPWPKSELPNILDRFR